jgi:hypothetical protein
MAKQAQAQRAKARKAAKPRSAGEAQHGAEQGTAFIDGVTFRAKPIQYTVIDGMAMVEGDINLGSVEQVEQQTKMRRAEVARGPVQAAAVITGPQFRWPNCTVPYQIASNLLNQARVTDAIAHWEAHTNFKFVPRTASNEAQFPDFVEFVPGNGCSSFVGKQGGMQTVTLGSECSAGNAIHEIGHTIGLWHEQSREDRDAFVTIQWANIIPNAVNNFAQHITDGDDVGAYDYGSIMHYPRNAFSSNGQDTIIPTDPSADIGQRTALSAGDIAAAASLCVKAVHAEVGASKTFLDPIKVTPEASKTFLDSHKTTPEVIKPVLDHQPPKIPKTLLDPPKSFHEPVKGFDPFGHTGVPFVLATGVGPAGGADAAAQQLASYRQVLNTFAQMQSEGLLGPADLARWQEYATAAQQLAGGWGGT